jgi:hypothetical protein
MSCSAPPARVRAAAGLLAVAGVVLVPALATRGAPGGDAALQRGDSAWAAGDRPAAGLGYAVAVAADSARSACAVYRLATVEAARQRLSAAVAVDRLYAALEAFGYRQLTRCFRLHAFYKYVRGVESWGHMKRGGFTARPTPPLVAAVPGVR